MEENRAVIAKALGIPEVHIAYVMDRLDKLGLVTQELRGDRRSGPVSIALKRYDGRLFRGRGDSFEEAVLRTVADALRQIPVSGSFVRAVGRITIRVTSVAGKCPLEYQPGRTWVLNEQGKIHPHFCGPAMVPLGKVLQNLPNEGEASHVPCGGCSLGRPREVEFELRLLPAIS